MHENDGYYVYQNTGDPSKTSAASRETVAWIVEDGSPVREGDLIARFDSSEIELKR